MARPGQARVQYLLHGVVELTRIGHVPPRASPASRTTLTSRTNGLHSRCCSGACPWRCQARGARGGGAGSGTLVLASTAAVGRRRRWPPTRPLSLPSASRCGAWVNPSYTSSTTNQAPYPFAHLDQRLHRCHRQHRAGRVARVGHDHGLGLDPGHGVDTCGATGPYAAARTAIHTAINGFTASARPICSRSGSQLVGVGARDDGLRACQLNR